jgi:hypothetical protein
MGEAIATLGSAGIESVMRLSSKPAAILSDCWSQRAFRLESAIRADAVRRLRLNAVISAEC